MVDVPIFMVIGETYGIENMGILVGILGIGWNIGAAIGPELGGLIYDSQNNYSLAFIVGALAMILAATCSIFIKGRKIKSFSSNN
jgi:MFS family permease